MNGETLLLDTNALIYFFEGRKKITHLVIHTPIICFSSITEIELLSSPHLDKQEILQIKQFLSLCQQVNLSEEIIATTINIRRQYRFKVPDAIIAATATVLGVPLVSADIAFQKVDGLILIADILA